MKNIYTQDYIKDLVARAAKADPECKVFGARSHKYQLNPPVSLEKVRALEEKMQIKLPEDYVYFLTQISNGGAGPYYGLYSLEELQIRQECVGQNNMQEPFINKELTKEKWNEAVDLMENGDDDQYESVRQQIATGAFIIGTQGCTYDHLLMCGGSEKGKLVYIDWNLEYDYPPVLTQMNFWDWYIGFFEDIIAGYNTDSYGYNKRGTEEELWKAYCQASNLKEKHKCLQGFARFSKLSEESIQRLHHTEDEETDDARLSLLLEYAPELGMTVFDELLAGKNVPAAISCIRRIPKEKKNQYYQRAIEILYTRSECVKDTLLFFISDLEIKKASDLIDYATNPATDINLVRTTIYVMGQCKDAMDYEEQFIRWMQGDDYDIARVALQASISANRHSPALRETYQWMAEKYKKDSTMRSNLKHVL